MRCARFNSHIQRYSETKKRPIVEIHKYISVFPHLQTSTFSPDEIKKAETAFLSHYGDLVPLKKNPNPTTLRFQSHEEEWYIGDILEQLKDQLSHPLSIEESMNQSNLEKQKEIEPFLQTFIQCASCPSITKK
jgi:hypothetical protein